ncbi:MAG: efflux RND transporter permease subunit [Paracoccus sp. (in: a-proteobacteria)]|uniref:efflux RND transporter permease subunit n=1 Tax=Paracoccus sp. TaxID=267 RepID=UPI0026DF7F7E|nr:efflux RND transporter permease subunit [Paracoccus sp. (in: a-proteobacteria)]MDO5612734.1 efflux RND transporter permease subunit [Paracoccus sp. (in: a-proteobacteria)]
MAERGHSPLPPGRGVLSLFTRHATLANIVMVVMIVTGLLAAPRMRSQHFPDSVVQTISVSVQWDGAGADDVDRAIVGVLEPALMGVEGVANTTSRAVEGAARLQMEFEPGWDMSRAMTEAEAAVDSAGQLPEGAETPELTRGAWRDGVADVVISGPVSVDLLGRFGDDLLTRLYQRGITRATLTGVAAPETLVTLRAADLERHDLTMEQVAAVISAAASARPAGEIASGAARVRTGAEARDPDAVGALVLRAQADGSNLLIRDVAEVTSSGAARAVSMFVGDDPAVIVQVQRSAAGDAIAMQREVEAALDEMRPGLPQGVELTLVRARAEQIAGRLALLVDNAVMGLALVLGLLFLFLNARTAIWVAAGIPAAMLAAIAMMYALGMTLNMISLFALILTLGIVVDDAIVVGEHADYRGRKLHDPPVLAAERAVRRMAAPVISSTLTTIIAFAGLMMIGGRFGTMVVDIPTVVGLVLIGSLVECLLVLPHHMSRALAGSRQPRWYDAPSRVANRGLDWFVRVVMRRVTEWIWRLRYPVLAGVLALFAWAAGVLMTGQVPWRFFDSPEQSSISGNFAMLPGSERADSLQVMRAMQTAVEDLGREYEARYGLNPVVHTVAQIGGNMGRPLPVAETIDADLLGAIQIELIDTDLRPYSSFEFLMAVQRAMPDDPRLEQISFRGAGSGPGGDAISVLMTGADAQRLKDAAEALKTRLAAYPEVSALEDSMSVDKEEMALALTPQGRALGFTTETLAAELRRRLAGIEAATFPVGTRSGTIQVELADQERRGDFLDRMRLRAPGGQWVPLGDIVTVSTRAGFSTIRRENGQRMILVTGDIAGDDPGAAAALTQRIDSEIMPEIALAYGVDFRMTGLAEQEEEFLDDALLGFAMAMLGIYVVLAWIFASWSRPLIVMSVIPFGLIGAVWGHYLWSLPMTMFSVVGLVGMSGIIINDSIVLISAIDEKAATRGLRPAVISAVAERFRPVMLTTATTVLGLAPLLYERSSQALFLKPTVVSLAYGLGFGMIVVLLIVPAVLAVGNDIGRVRRAFRRGWRSAELSRPLRVGAGVAALGFAATILPVTLLPAVGVALPAWWPVAASAGQAFAWYLGAVMLALLAAVLVSLAGRSRDARSRHPAE